MSVNEVNALLGQPGSGTPKELQGDKAMLELLYATGIGTSELINLKLEDVNMQVGYITCRDRNKERMVPHFRKERAPGPGPVHGPGPHGAAQGENLEWLFTNCNGQAMSRQGFWKLIKHYWGESRDQDRHHPPTHCAIPSPPHLIRSGAAFVRASCPHIRLRFYEWPCLPGAGSNGHIVGIKYLSSPW